MRYVRSGETEVQGSAISSEQIRLASRSKRSIDAMWSFEVVGADP